MQNLLSLEVVVYSLQLIVQQQLDLRQPLDLLLRFCMARPYVLRFLRPHDQPLCTVHLRQRRCASEAWHEEKQEAKRFVKKYDIEQIVTCFWDKDDPSKAAMNNDGGKGWGKIRTGIALAIAGTALVSPGFLFFCYICVGSCCIKDHSMLGAKFEANNMLGV